MLRSKTKLEQKTLLFIAKQQMIVIKQLTKQIADMEDKFQLSQEGVSELTEQYSTEIDDQNKLITDLRREINYIAVRRTN